LKRQASPDAEHDHDLLTFGIDREREVGA